MRVRLESRHEDTLVLQFSVIDTGIGIAPEKQQLVFDPFRQADGSPTRRYRGTGLGLTISARLVKLMGGEIGLESQPGRGSRFFFTVQLEAAPETISPPKPAQLARLSASLVHQPVRPLRILLAEDNIVNQKLALEFLKREGHMIKVVADGQEAVAATRDETFDLVLMDVQMPTVDGLQATEKIRASERGTGRHTPIIAMTASAMNGDEERCLEAGMDDYVSKPVDFAALRETLAKFGAVETATSGAVHSRV